MNLLEQAEADNLIILEDNLTGFGRSLTYTLADGSASGELIGQYIRRGVKMDPNTGLSVATDEAAVTVRISSFKTLFPGRDKPMVGDKIDVSDSTGTVIHYRVPADSLMADRTAGRFTLAGLKVI